MIKNTEESLDKLKRKHCALVILRTLERSPCYQANSEVLQSWLDHIALGLTHDQFRQLCQSLYDVGFLTLEDRAQLFVLSLTNTGRDVARGSITSDLVERPQPECPY